MARDGQAGRDRIQVEHFADEVAQRCDQLRGVHPAARRQLAGRRGREPDLLVRPQQQHVRERAFHGVADAARSVGTAGHGFSQRLRRGLLIQ
ncbi:MAG: hypothetical protein A2579_06110 [Lysobacterales bacterium RIFOXYD1_FULL_69_11]|nr:MAG: hypothetical protein A2579_06110 [Xanthomonadales bacterium RIFOXYD1_FULL_69_11]